MGRTRLKTGQQGTITTHRVYKHNGTWKRAQNAAEATHWAAETRIGQAVGKPRLIRRVATSKRAAQLQLQEALQEATKQAQYAGQHINPNTTPTQLWDYYTQTERWATLAPNSRATYENAKKHSQNDSPNWWQTPIDRAYKQLPLEQLIKTHANQHGTRQATVLKTILRNIGKLAADIINLTPLSVIPAPQRAYLVAGAAQHDTNKTLNKTQLKQLIQDADQYADQHPQAPLARDAADMIALNTHLALRIGELQALTWDNINLQTGEVTGVQSIKTGTTYPTKTLPQWQTDRLKHRKTTSQGPYVFAQTRYVKDVIRKVFTECGHSDITMHNIRKSVGGIIFDTYGLRAASAWLAHRNVQTTIDYYIKTGDQSPTEQVDTLT
ncbi:tyrosine-type recombinase/integrase [Schaalia sp. ZJ1691]|uniref:tyrosine-type recombinase/integrase n=1 Tax=Schaalia sp. ZJ1691 TaxID=2709404 RepID=UPI0013ECE557|nr:tyrosine-type recombinase/integrase [Schaalia sp. ZJ1691]